MDIKNGNKGIGLLLTPPPPLTSAEVIKLWKRHMPRMISFSLDIEKSVSTGQYI